MATTAPSSRFKSALAAVSTIAGLLAGLLGGWLSGHWLWAPACGFLVLVGVAGGAEAIKARNESRNESKGTSEGPVTNISANASYGDIFMAGRDVNETRTIDQRKTINFRGLGGITAIIIAILAFGGALGGTAYIAQLPNPITIESPQNLITDASHASPEAAVKGMVGNILLSNRPGVCSYLLPGEQATCNADVFNSLGNGNTFTAYTGSVGVGNAVIKGNLALVPVIGRMCSSGTCSSVRGEYPSGKSFQTAFQQTMSNDWNGLIPCEEVAGSWYVDLG